MSSEKIVNELFKFLQTEVSLDSLFEADKIAYPEVEEGKLPDDPSQIKDPDKEIQLLSEKDKEAKGESKPTEVKEEPNITKVEKEMDDKTPNVDKLTQDDKTGVDPAVKASPGNVKDEKKVDPEVTGVEKEKGSKKDEGKLPDDPSIIDDPDGDIQALAEERVLTSVSDEQVAKDIASKYPGSRIITDDVGGKKSFIVMVTEEKVEEEEVVEEGKDERGKRDGTGPYKDSQEKGEGKRKQAGEKCPNESKVEEDVDVTVKTDDKEVNIVSADGATQVTTLDTASAVVEPAMDLEEQPIADLEEEPIVSDEDEVIELPDGEYEEEEALEVAEKIFIKEFLELKSELSVKEIKFIEEVDKIKLSEANQKKVFEKLEGLRRGDK